MAEVKTYSNKGKRGQSQTFQSEKEAEPAIEEIDPYCEFCYFELGKTVQHKAFCLECNSFLCKPCITKHKKSQTVKDHILLEGTRMPKSLEDKPLKYPNCDIHHKKGNDCYCYNHGYMICQDCARHYHQECKTQFLPRMCCSLGYKDLQRFKTKIEHVKDVFTNVKAKLENNITEIGQSRLALEKEAEKLHEDLIEKLNKSFRDTVKEINRVCDENLAEVRDKISKISTITDDLEKSDSVADRFNNEFLGPSIFLKCQSIVKTARNHVTFVKKQFNLTELSFRPRSDNVRLVDWCKNFGFVKENSTPISEAEECPYISFPDVSELEATTKSREQRIGTLKTAKKAPLNVKGGEDVNPCDISGMAVTMNGSLLILDNGNRSVKIVSPVGHVQSELHIPAKLQLVTIINNKQAAVFVTEMAGMPMFQSEFLHILNISNEKTMTLDRSVPCIFGTRGICAYKNYLITSNSVYPDGVKMVDLCDPDSEGIAASPVVWCVEAANSNKVFRLPGIIEHQFTDGRSTIVVADWGKFTITTIAAENGTHINTARVRENIDATVKALTADEDGCIYGLVNLVNDISIWSPDLQESRILLPGGDLQPNPTSIVYNDQAQELFVSYQNSDFLDCYQII